MIELRNVQRRYAMAGQTVHALAGVDLHIGAGEFVAITGPRARASRACSTSWAAWTIPATAST